MRIAKNDVPVKISIPGATARQQTDFGTAEGYGAMAGEYFSLGAGTDIAPLLEGLEGDLCQSPHWGYVIEGEVVVTFGDGSEETVTGGDLFYWKPGHTVRVVADAELILFSPQHEHVEVVEHLRKQLAG
ncbi:MAG: cupin domain-containing protein [Planctomycetota bacterium]